MLYSEMCVVVCGGALVGHTAAWLYFDKCIQANSSWTALIYRPEDQMTTYSRIWARGHVINLKIY